MTPEKAIQDAMRVQNFLKDEAVVTALAGMKWRNYDEFENAKSGEERMRAQAKAIVLREFADALQVVIDTGELEALKIADAVKKAQRAPHKE